MTGGTSSTETVRSLFKSNDVRGVFGQGLDRRFAVHFGAALVGALGARRVLLGHDARSSSGELHAALVYGVECAGGQAETLGLAATEQLYYLTFTESDRWDVAVMITASHNPPEYNGFKVIGPGAQVFDESHGLTDLCDWIVSAQGNGAPWRQRRGSGAGPAALPEAGEARAPTGAAHDANADIVPDADQHGAEVTPGTGAYTSTAGAKLEATAQYVRFCREKVALPSTVPYKVVVDAGNGVAGVLWDELERQGGPAIEKLNYTPDGAFPAHLPDPSRSENLEQLRRAVAQESRAAIGFAYDGDADRLVMVLPDGRVLGGDELTVVLAEALFSDSNHGASVRCGMSMVAGRRAMRALRRRFGDPVLLPVGHAKVKRCMRLDERIRFAGEHSGHYFFRELGCSESSLLATLYLLRRTAAADLMRLGDELVSDGTEERLILDVPVESPEAGRARCVFAARAALRRYPEFHDIICERGGTVSRGQSADDLNDAEAIRVDFDAWWFCVRASQTEPFVRLYFEPEVSTGETADDRPGVRPSVDGPPEFAERGNGDARVRFLRQALESSDAELGHDVSRYSCTDHAKESGG